MSERRVRMKSEKRSRTAEKADPAQPEGLGSVLRLELAGSVTYPDRPQAVDEPVDDPPHYTNRDKTGEGE